MSIDRLSNMLSIIKNAALAGNEHVEIPHSKECEAVAKVLESEGYLQDVKPFKEKNSSFKKLGFNIVFENNKPKMREIKRVSKPGFRVYKGSQEIGSYLRGYGTYIVSTNRGIMTGSEARKKKLGGEVVAKVH